MHMYMFSEDTFVDANRDASSDVRAIVGSDRQCVCAEHEDSILIATSQKV
jgi:hypothetical protein